MSNVEDRRDYGTFIPSFLDDFRLDPMAFRLYAHIARRAGSGICWESIDRMAEVCQMNRKTAYKSFDILKSQNMILVEKRKGQTSLITLTNHTVWEPIPNKGQVTPIPNQVHPYTKSGIPPVPNQGQPPIPDLVQPPVPNQGHKGIPIKVIPLSESIEGKNTHKEDFLESENPENSFPEEKKEPDAIASNPEIKETPPPTPAPLRRAKISDIEKFEQKWQAENNLIDCKKLSRDSGFKKFVLARFQKLPSSKKGDWTPDFADAGNYIAAGQFDLKRRGEIELIHEAFTEYQRSQLEATQPTSSSDRQPMPERSAVPTNLKNLIQK